MLIQLHDNWHWPERWCLTCQIVNPSEALFEEEPHWQVLSWTKTMIAAVAFETQPLRFSSVKGKQSFEPSRTPPYKTLPSLPRTDFPPVPVSSAPAARLTACLHTNVVLPPNYAQASDMCQGRHVSAELMMLRRTAHCPSACMHECECVCVCICEPRHVNVSRTLPSD